MKNSIFWNVTVCNQMEVYQYSGGSSTANVKFQSAVLFMISSILYGYKTSCLSVVDPMVL